LKYKGARLGENNQGVKKIRGDLVPVENSNTGKT